MFPDGSYHGGGDEPIYKCWEDEASVREYMSAHNATGDDLLNKFLTKEVDFIKKAGKQPILWEGQRALSEFPFAAGSSLNNYCAYRFCHQQ